MVLGDNRNAWRAYDQPGFLRRTERCVEALGYEI
jgi:hypothetical protein